ncbi:MAG: DUF971 domain-containing protein [Pseudomonadota bacterium]
MQDETASARSWPTELRLDKDKGVLTATFDDGASFGLAAELLRVLSPSAEVQGHSPEERVTVPGKRNVKILKVDMVGNYAVRLAFDDGHDTGLYTWDYLYDLGAKRDVLFEAYLKELADKGLSR